MFIAMLLAAAGALAVPCVATAATAPSLIAPAAGADPLVEGGSVEFTWSGDLQGDVDSLDRSFFRVEVMASDAVPAGAQTVWPEGDLETYVQTSPGDSTDAMSLGVPRAGEYRWRVCAWGVVDDVAANEIQQLPGGCSAARTLKTVAAADSGSAIGTISLEEKTHVDGHVTTVYKPRDITPMAADPVTTTPAPAEPVDEPVAKAAFQSVGTTNARAGKGSSLGLDGGGDALNADDAAARDQDGGVTGAVLGGLGSNLPLVPIPFWTLALLLACVPILIAWRRSVLGMFDWADGSLDGRGAMPDPLAELAFVPVARDIKHGSKTADADAPAPRHSATDHDAPGRGRHAA